MIAISTTGKFLNGLIEYNEKKVGDGQAVQLFVNNLTQSIDDFKRQYFTLKNNWVQKTNPQGDTVLHLSLNFHELDAEKLTDAFLNEISREFLEKCGISHDHPYLIYRHYDKKHPHVHIIMPNYTEEGKKINMDNSVRKFIAISKNLEKEHGLVIASDKKNRIGAEKTQEESGSAFDIIERELRTILSGCPQDLETVHKKLLNAHYNFASTECNISYALSSKHNGITFYLADKKTGKQMSSGIKGSKIPPNCSYNKLMSQLEANKNMRTKLRYGLQKSIAEELQKCHTLDEFVARLKDKKINVKIYKNDQTEKIFGIEFKEGRSGAEFKGSDIHRNLSWNAIQKELSKNFDKKIKAYLISDELIWYTDAEQAMRINALSLAGITIKDAPTNEQKQININLAQLLLEYKHNNLIHKTLAQCLEKPYVAGVDNFIFMLDEQSKLRQIIKQPLGETIPITQTNTPMYSIKELKEIISIKELAEHFGYKIAEGKRLQSVWVTMKAANQSAIIIANNKGKFNYYQDSADSLKKGSVVDFVINQKIVDNATQAVQWLNNYLGNSPIVENQLLPQAEPKKPLFEAPTFVPYPFVAKAGVNDYLAHHGISEKTCSALFPMLAGSVTREELLSDAFKKCAPYYNNASTYAPTIYNLLDIRNPTCVIGQEIKGVGTKGHILANSNKTYGAWFIPPPKTDGVNNAIVITESPAKTLAYMAINPNSNHYPFATMGNSSVAVLNYLTELHKEGISLILGGDNDIQGQYFNARILSSIASQELKTTIAPSYSADKSLFKITALLSTDATKNESAVVLFKKLAEENKLRLEEAGEQLILSIPIDDKGVTLLHKTLGDLANHLKLNATLVKPTLKDFNDDLLEQNRTVKQKERRGLRM